MDNNYAYGQWVELTEEQLADLQQMVAAIKPARKSHADFENAVSQKFQCSLTSEPERFQFAYQGLKVVVCYFTRDGCETLHSTVTENDKPFCRHKEAYRIEDEMKLLFGVTAHDIETKNRAYAAYCMALLRRTLNLYPEEP